MEVTVVTRATQTLGQYWEMIKAIGDRLPKDLDRNVGYHQDPRRFNDLIARVVRLDLNSDTFRQIEEIAVGRVPAQHIETKNQYTNEKTTPSFFYPKGYEPNSVEEQVKRLLTHYDWLDASHTDSLTKSWGVIEQTDGLYVVLKPTVVAEKLEINDPWANFGVLTERGPLVALNSQRKFSNYWAGQMDAKRYRLAESAKAALKRLEAEQPGDLLVFPAQTGKLYAGFSPRNARWEAEHNSQWPLPAYMVAWMLFSNPHRLERYEHLIIDCPGDEYCIDDGRGFEGTLSFGFGDEKLNLEFRWSDYPYDPCGSASGFFQQ